VDRQIGEGGMGRVLAVTHTKLGKKYAIKIVKSDALAVPGVAERFLREARAASQLKSDHVGEVTDVGELATGEPYMVMEMLEGQDLGHLIEAGPLEPSQAVGYMLQACEALAEAHALGMVHRDIKPANLFVIVRRDGSHVVKVLDFGIATASHGEVSGLTETCMVMGSPQYMSPEQLRSAKSVDARSDIWAVGVTLYQLLSARMPFASETFTGLAIKIATEPHEPLTWASPALAQVVERCFAKDPAKRYADIAEFASALAPFTADGRAAAARVANTLRNGVVTPAVFPGSAPVVGPGTGAAPTVATTLAGGAASLITRPATRRSRTAKRFAGGLGVAVLIAAGGGAVIHRSRSAGSVTLPRETPATTTPAPAPAPPPLILSSTIRVTTVPADAAIEIDDVEVANPYVQSVPRDGAKHRIDIRAPGYAMTSRWVTFETDRDLAITLFKPVEEPAPRPDRPTPKPRVTQRPQAAAKSPPAPPAPPPSRAAGAEPKTSATSVKLPVDEAKAKKSYKGTKGSIITEYPPE
jgi:serine/threonine-protein kinase